MSSRITTASWCSTGTSISTTDLRRHSGAQTKSVNPESSGRGLMMMPQKGNVPGNERAVSLGVCRPHASTPRTSTQGVAVPLHPNSASAKSRRSFDADASIPTTERMRPHCDRRCMGSLISISSECRPRRALAHDRGGRHRCDRHCLRQRTLVRLPLSDARGLPSLRETAGRREAGRTAQA